MRRDPSRAMEDGHEQLDRMDIVRDDDGMWCRRSAFEDVFEANNPGVDEDRIPETLDEMVDSGELDTKDIGGMQFLRMPSRWESAKMAVAAARRRLVGWFR